MARSDLGTFDDDRPRLAIAYEFQYEYGEPVKDKLREVLIEDNDLCDAILTKFNAECKAHKDRLMHHIEGVAFDARKEVARQRISKDSAKIADSDLKLLAPDELVKLIMSANEKEIDITIRRIIRLCREKRRIINEVFDKDSEERIFSKKIFYVLTEMWGKGNNNDAINAAEVLNHLRLGHHQQDQQWFKDGTEDICRETARVCELAEIKRGPEPFSEKVNFAIGILSHLGGKAMLVPLQDLLDRLRRHLDKEGESRKYVDNGFVAGYISNFNSVSHINNAISEITARTKDETRETPTVVYGGHISLVPFTPPQQEAKSFGFLFLN